MAALNGYDASAMDALMHFPHVRIAVVEAQRNECLRNGGHDGGVWIHHGIQ